MTKQNDVWYAAIAIPAFGTGQLVSHMSCSAVHWSIITVSWAQVRKLQALFGQASLQEVEVRTVDGFQVVQPTLLSSCCILNVNELV